jgi:hypothetical protein
MKSKEKPALGRLEGLGYVLGGFGLMLTAPIILTGIFAIGIAEWAAAKIGQDKK